MVLLNITYSFVTNEHSDGSSSSGTNSNRRGQRRQMLSFEDILQEILVSITEGANGRTPMFLNPGKLNVTSQMTL